MAAGIMADFACECGYRFEHFFREPPDALPCESPLPVLARDPLLGAGVYQKCKAHAQRVFTLPGQLAPRDAAGFRSFLVDQAADGTYSHPAHPSAPIPAGFVRKELRTVAEIRSFERDVNARDKAQWERAREREDEGYAQAERMRRSTFFQQMQKMSAAGRDLARVAIDHNNNRPRRRFRDHTYVEAFSKDSSNREPGRNELSNWKQVRR